MEVSMAGMGCKWLLESCLYELGLRLQYLHKGQMLEEKVCAKYQSVQARHQIGFMFSPSLLEIGEFFACVRDYVNIIPFS